MVERRGILRDAACVLAGVALPLAFSPFGWFPIAPLSLAVLFWSWFDATPRRAFMRGWLYGVGQFGFGIFWIHESFQFSHVALSYAVVMTALLVIGMALYPALAGLLARCLVRGGIAVQALMVMPAVWILVEWLRGWLFTGFGWLQVGYSQLGAPLDGVFPVLGVLGVGWAVALSAGALVLAILGVGRMRLMGLMATALLWLAAGVLGRVDWTEPAGDALAVALVQGNVPQDQKWLASMRRPTLERYLRLTSGHWGADLVVWPETALPGLRDDLAPFISMLRGEASARGTDVVVGVPEIDRESQTFYNSVLVLGARETVFRKRHLVPFGEYLPLDRWLRPGAEALGIPVANFSAGAEEQALPRAAGHPLAVSICYEIAFGNEIRRALPEAEMLITVSNDAWFGTSIGPHQHMQMAAARALETGRYLLRATNTGITAIVAPDGAIDSALPQFEAGVLSGRALPRRGATPYVVVGDMPVVVAATLVVMLAAWRSRRGAFRRN